MTTLYAQPYDITATGFYFDSAEEYASKAAKAFNSFGGQVEEFEIQFIDGDGIDAELFRAVGVHQGNVAAFFDAIEGLSSEDKTKIIIVAGEAGYQFDLRADNADDLDIDLYECDSLRDLAMQFVEEGLFGEIPERLHFYIDYDAIARDLSADYSDTIVDGVRYAYRCG